MTIIFFRAINRSLIAVIFLLCILTIAIPGCTGGGEGDSNDDTNVPGLPTGGTEGVRAYVVANDPTTKIGIVSIVNCSTNQVDAIILSDELYDAGNIAATHNSQYVYVTCYDTGKVVKIDCSTNDIVGVINVRLGARGIEASSDDRYVYVVSANVVKVLSRIDVLTDQLIEFPLKTEQGSTLGFPWFLALTPDDDTAYIASGDLDNISGYLGKVTNLLDGNPVVSAISVKGIPTHDLVVTPNGEYVYGLSASIHGDGMYKVNTADETDIQYIDIYGYRIAVSPVSNDLYISAVSPNVRIIDSTTDQILYEIRAGNIARGIAFTPDGKYAYVASGGIYVIDVYRQAVVVEDINVGTRAVDVAIVQ